MATTAPKAPTSELGSVLSTWDLPGWAALGGGTFVDNREYVPDLVWPTSVTTFERMTTDSQLDALMRGTILPITRYAWGLDANGAKPALVDAIRRDFNLALIDDAIAERQTGRSGQPVGRGKDRFSFAKHQAEALKALRYGHAYFEQVGQIGEDGLWHPRKLAARPPWSISQIRVADDGGLVAIKQQVGLDSPEIPVDRLVAYIWDQEPGNWAGRSLFRSCYREWLIKDRLLRVDAILHERAGGIYIPEAPKDATPAEIAALAQLSQQLRIGETAGGAVPAGTKGTFVRGTGSDVIGSINRHDEAMARAFLLMVIQLGSTQTGSRALGDSFTELVGWFQEAIAIWFRDVFNEHVLEDYVDWNYGEGEEFAPRLVFAVPQDQQPTAALDAAAEASAPIAAAMEKLSAELDRERRYRTRPARVAAAGSLPLPDRQLRRQPYEHEVAASVDFQQIDENWQSEVDQLIAEWQTIRAAQISEIRDLVVSADGDLEQLALLEATAAGGDRIASRLQAMAAAGAAEAVGEATRQGAAATAPDLTAIEGELEARASALERLLARSLSEAAGRRAVALTGGSLPPSEVAGEVASYLAGLTDTYLSDQFGGALSAAQNAGRMAVMAANGASAVYASELLDVNTCGPCRLRDGHQYASIEAAAEDYPAGGFRDCEGGPRCRGTIVAVYDEAAATLAAMPAPEPPRPAPPPPPAPAPPPVQASDLERIAAELAEAARAVALEGAQTRNAFERLIDHVRGRADVDTANAIAREKNARAELDAQLAQVTAMLGRLEQQSAATEHETRKSAGAITDLQERVAAVNASVATRSSVDAITKRLGTLAAEIGKPRPRGATTKRGPDGTVEITYHYPDEGGQ